MFSQSAPGKVTHTALGKFILEAFVVDICKAPTDWNMADIADEFIKEVKQRPCCNPSEISPNGWIKM